MLDANVNNLELMKQRELSRNIIKMINENYFALSFNGRPYSANDTERVMPR